MQLLHIIVSRRLRRPRTRRPAQSWPLHSCHTYSRCTSLEHRRYVPTHKQWYYCNYLSFKGSHTELALSDTFKTATHRVALPPLQQSRGDGANVTRARYSIPYFFAPNDDAVVECLPSTVRRDRPAAYEPIMFKDYGAWRSKYAYQQPEVEV